MYKLLLTGGTGFLGKPVMKLLEKENIELHVTSRIRYDNTNFHQCNLLMEEEVSDLIRLIKPDGLINLAWEVAASNYLTSASNLDWLGASLCLAKHFVENGGTRMMMTGTCFEYEFSDRALNEEARISPYSLYGQTKNACYSVINEYFMKKNAEFIWGRLFYLFGKDENPKRVVPYIINNLLENNPVVCKNSSAIRDYMLAEDAAEAIVQTFFSDVSGPINIASGNPITMEQLFSCIGETLDKSDLISYRDEPVNPSIMMANIEKLKQKVGFSLEKNLLLNIKKTLESYL